MNTIYLALLGLLSFGLFGGCASIDSIDTSTPQGLYKKATELMAQERYEEAISHLSDLKNKYPYNNLAKESELQIANIHFTREAYVEAESAYKIFKEFHPRHPKVDFATFRIAMSMYKQLPEGIDQDLALAEDAQMYFKQVYTSYPQSDYANSAREHELKCRTKLARSIYYIAEFYFKRKKYDSALGRFDEVLKSYPDTGVVPKSLYGAAFSAYKVDKINEAKAYYEVLQKTYPNNRWAKRAKRDLKW